MEVANLILEYIKALAWPVIVLVLVLKFRSTILRILNAIADRFMSAETVKLGVFGQEVQLSGTAKELQRVGQELLASSPGDQRAQARAGQIMQAIPQLNNPFADIIGTALLNAPKGGLTADELLERVLNAVSPRREGERFPPSQAQFILMSMSREVEKVLATLVKLEFALGTNNRYSLTSSGREFFEKVAIRQKHLLSRFGATEPRP